MVACGDSAFLRVCIIKIFCLQPLAPAAETLHPFPCGELVVCTEAADFVEFISQIRPAIRWDKSVAAGFCHGHSPQGSNDSGARIPAAQSFWGILFFFLSSSIQPRLQDAVNEERNEA